jgi:transposase
LLAKRVPLYRQSKMLACQGIDLDRSTLAFWVGYAAAELMPLYGRLKANFLTSAKLAVDETPVPVLDPGRGQTKTGYFWAMARDDRPWGGTDPPAVVYTYAPGRGSEHLEKLLANFAASYSATAMPLTRNCRLTGSPSPSAGAI